MLTALPAGYAFRRGFRGATAVFYTAVASLIVPSIVGSLGIGVQFRLIDETVSGRGAIRRRWIAEVHTSAGMFTSGLGAHLTWTLPFGLLIMFAVFNRFDGRFEEAARDLGATHADLPPRGAADHRADPRGHRAFGFTLWWTRWRASQAFGSVQIRCRSRSRLTTNVTNPELYALGTVTTGVSLLMIAVSLAISRSAGAAAAPSSVTDRREYWSSIPIPRPSMTDKIRAAAEAVASPARGSSP